MEFTSENKRRFEKLLERYPVKRSALLPALHLAQQQAGYLSNDALEYLAGVLDLTPAQVHDTASFYSLFRFEPQGRLRLSICTNLSCSLQGAEKLLEHACGRLGIREGATTADGSFTVERVECLAACGGAPAVQVNGQWLEQAVQDDLEGVLGGEPRCRPFDWPKSPGETILLRNCWKPNSASIRTYQSGGGYSRLKSYLSMDRGEIIEAVKQSNLRGRGGAGFPAGLKWSFLPKDNPKPRYLCVNADEGEPGTYKDRLLIERDPHQLIEAIVVSAYAVQAKTAYIYIRGEFHQGIAILEQAIEEARAAGFVGSDILGTGVGVEIRVHSGAGSYECGEETALIESLEGKRGQPRLKPPFPASVGLYGCPTIINNVETLVCVPLILERGARWFAEYGSERNGGPKLYCISGQVERPGVYEAPMGRITLRQLIEEYAGGVPQGRRLRAVLPGGSSTPALTADEIDVALDFDSLAKAGSMLGSAATIVMDDSTCMVWMAQKLAYFYQHESCGKCSPCREGTGWMLRLLTRIEAGSGTRRDLETLESLFEAISGKTVCPFGDAAIGAPQSALRKFREEFEYHVREGRCWRTVAGSFAEAQAMAAQQRSTAGR